MKANELRIGSIVKSLVNDEEFSIVEDIGHRASLGHYVSLNNQHSGVWLVHQERELILGIPLTEEWLLKFGFVLENGWFKKNRLLLFNINNNYFTTLSKEIVSVNITTVHQLQNLYFALTGEELTMK